MGRAELYQGTAFANKLAKRGFAVLVHDAFLWGSRRFLFETMPRTIAKQIEDWELARKHSGESPTEFDRYNIAPIGVFRLITNHLSPITFPICGLPSIPRPR